jgi:hypothetical protein
MVRVLSLIHVLLTFPCIDPTTQLGPFPHNHLVATEGKVKLATLSKMCDSISG